MQNQDHNFKNQNSAQDNKKFNNTNNNQDTAEDRENLDQDSSNHTLTQEIEKNITDNEATTKDEATEFKDKYLRTLAELENIKRYSAKQIEETSHYAINKFAKELIVIMDIFNKALATIDIDQIKEENFKTFISGITLTKQELEKIFKKFDIQALDNKILGQKFDPNFHEALMSKADLEKDNDTIFEVFEQGYVIKDKLLRPAKVGIIKNS